MAKGKSKRKNKDGPSGAEGGAGPSAAYVGPGESWGGEHMNQAPAPLMAMHPSGEHIAVAYGKGVAVFDASTGAQIPLRAAAKVPSIGEGVAHTPASPEMRAPSNPTDSGTPTPSARSRSTRPADSSPPPPTIRRCGSSPRTRTRTSASADGTIARNPCAAYDDEGKHLMISNKYGDVHVVLTDRKPNDPVGTDHEYGALREVDDPAFLPRALLRRRDGPDVPAREQPARHRRSRPQAPRVQPADDRALDPRIVGHPDFLFGHLAFVSCATAVPEPDDDDDEGEGEGEGAARDNQKPKKIERLASGGGDGAVRLFRLDDGEELASAQLSAPVDPPSPEELEAIVTGQAPRIPVNAPAVTSIDAHPRRGCRRRGGGRPRGGAHARRRPAGGGQDSGARVWGRRGGDVREVPTGRAVNGCG